MSSARWQLPGYSELVAVDSSAGAFVVTFANGDVVAVPPALIGGSAPGQAWVDPDEPLALKLRVGDEVVSTIGWAQIRAATDEAFAQHMRDLDADESRRLGRRLKALREDRGIKQSDLAGLVKMTAPQLSKIEKGSHDMRVSTVRSLLRALDASFADITGPDAPELSLKTLARRMTDAGVTSEVASALLSRVPRPSVHAFLERVLGWGRQAIEAGQLQVAPLAGSVQFKAPRANQPEQTPLLHLAWSVATAGRAAATVDHITAIPSDPAVARRAVEADLGELNLRTLLTWTWRQGTPVLPMTGRGGFSAAVWNLDDSPVIVLKEARDVPAFWLFDLAHELGHIARGHVTTRSIVDVEEPTSGDALDSTDAQEREANEYALSLLVPDYQALVAEVRKRSRGDYLAFKGAVATTARDYRVNAGVLGVIAAHELTDIGQHKDRWGSSINLSKEDGEGHAAAVDVARQFLHLETLDETDRVLLETVVLGL